MAITGHVHHDYNLPFLLLSRNQHTIGTPSCACLSPEIKVDQRTGHEGKVLVVRCMVVSMIVHVIIIWCAWLEARVVGLVCPRDVQKPTVEAVRNEENRWCKHTRKDVQQHQKIVLVHAIAVGVRIPGGGIIKLVMHLVSMCVNNWKMTKAMVHEEPHVLTGQAESMKQVRHEESDYHHR